MYVFPDSPPNQAHLLSASLPELYEAISELGYVGHESQALAEDVLYGTPAGEN
jgi:hypothetical protein